MCIEHSVEINLQNQPYMRWNIYITDALNLLLHVSALHGCHHQGVFTAVKAVLSKGFLACSTATRLHTY